jgi:drug/metabolite transporter (DMT)-like permease
MKKQRQRIRRRPTPQDHPGTGVAMHEDSSLQEIGIGILAGLAICALIAGATILMDRTNTSWLMGWMLGGASLALVCAQGHLLGIPLTTRTARSRLVDREPWVQATWLSFMVMVIATHR